MTSFAARPSTDVDPMCSMPRAASPSAVRISADRASKRWGPFGVVRDDCDRLGWGGPWTQGFSDGSGSWCRVISSLVGTRRSFFSLLVGLWSARSRPGLPGGARGIRWGGRLGTW